MDGQQQIIPSGDQEERDYADSLEPGYRFCPTDSELIVHYLKRKIETGTHPMCRLYEINLYDHNPQQLSERYRSHENKWYFLTSRERKYPRGTLPSRRTKNFGFWKTTQRYTTVYNNAREVVGSRRSLAYYDDKEKKTLWLMHEYTTNDPNLPIGSDGNKLSDYVLCKVYKKKIVADNDNQSGQVPNGPNQPEDEPPTRRRRVTAGNQPNGTDQSIQNPRTDVEIATPISYQQPVNNIMDTRINPNLIRRSSSPIDAREQVGPYSENYGCNMMQGRAPDPLTSTESIDDPVNWANINYEDLPPLSSTDSPHDPTNSETLPYMGLNQDIDSFLMNMFSDV